MDRAKVINELNECIEHIRKNKFNKIPCWGNCQSAMIDAIELLKSQPEIVRCGECAKWFTDDCIVMMAGGITQDYWFCADGERGGD